jgi:hypothetical protein
MVRGRRWRRRRISIEAAVYSRRRAGDGDQERNDAGTRSWSWPATKEISFSPRAALLAAAVTSGRTALDRQANSVSNDQSKGRLGVLRGGAEGQRAEAGDEVYVRFLCPGPDLRSLRLMTSALQQLSTESCSRVHPSWPSCTPPRITRCLLVSSGAVSVCPPVLAAADFVLFEERSLFPRRCPPLPSSAPFAVASPSLGRALLQ